MEKKSSGIWKFLAIVFGAALAGMVCYYVHQQNNPEYDPWEKPWKNSSSPIDLIHASSLADADEDEEDEDPLELDEDAD